MAWTIDKLTEWNPAHLMAAATFGAEQGPMWMDHFETYRDRLGAMETWEGESKEGAFEAASWSASTAVHAAFPAINGAAQATEIASAAEAMQQATLGQIEAAAASGMVVSPDLKQVTGPPGTQEIADQYAGMIKHYLGQFQSVLDDGARRLQAHSDELSTTGFPDSGVGLSHGHSEPHIQMGTDSSGSPQIQLGGQPLSGGGNGHVSMVDNHTFKQDPIISNPKEPDKPNPIVGPPPKYPPAKTDEKSYGDQLFDGFVDVAGGTATAIGGAAAVIGGGVAEPETGGLSSVAVVGGIAGITAGTKLVEDGLDKLRHLGDGGGG